MKEEKAKINCSTFRTHEFIAKDIIDKINKAEGVRKKAEVAENLQKEVNMLLNCEEYKEDSLNCKNCRTIANLRKKTAELVIKAKKLA